MEAGSRKQLGGSSVTWLAYPAIVALLLTTGCALEVAPESSDSVQRQSSALTTSTSATSNLNQPDAGLNQPNQQEITIASLPSSRCVLTEDATGNHMSVFADDEGLVYLYAAPSDVSHTFTLTCDESIADVSGGKADALYHFDLASSDTYIPAQARATSKRRRFVPPLSHPETVSQSAIIAAGFPPRPQLDDPGYAKWSELVSNGVTLIDAATVDTTFHRGTATPAPSPNWGGVALNYNAPNNHYSYVNSYFYVPNFGQQGGGTSIASLWAGLGGWYDNLIIQAGVDGVCTGGVCTIKPWYEYYSALDPLHTGYHYQQFTVRPNTDYMYVAVWESDASGNYGPSYHGYGSFYVWNTTLNNGFFVILPKPTGTFVGATCESIVERVADCGSYCYLSSWSSWLYTRFQCYDQGQTHYWNVSTDPYLLITMTNSSNQALVAPQATPTYWAGMDWQRSH